MKEALLYSIMGLGAGGFFALMAMGIVTAYKGSGVINFSHGAIAMYVAFQFFYLRNEGIFHFPWFDILPTKTLNLPVRMSLNDGVGINVWLAAILAMATALLLGAGIHYLVFKPLRNAAPLGKVIGAIGVMTYLLGLASLQFGAIIPNPEAVLFPRGTFRNFLGLGGQVSHESLAFAALSIVIGGGVWWFYKSTRAGLATRAAAGNEKGAVLLGYSPDRLALYNWMLAAALAGVVGIFSGTITGSLGVGKFTGLIVPALGAALIGAMSSIPLAVAGGLIIGMLQNFTGTWMTSQSWFPAWGQSGIREAVPLIIIVVVLFTRGKSLPVRGNIEEKRLPLAPYPKRVGIYVAVFVPLGFIFAAGLPGDWGWAGLSGPWGFHFSVTLVAAMFGLSMVLLSGYVGQISLVQITLSGIAAFITARLVAKGVGRSAEFDPFAVQGPGWPWPLASIVGVAVAVIVGMLLAIPALRIRGVQLAVVTIAASISIYTLFFENSELTALQGGSAYIFPAPTFFGVNMGSTSSSGLTDSPRFALFALVVLAGLCVFVANIRRGSSGRRFLAVRANERAAASAGIDVPKTKILAFGLASAVAGVAGIMTAYQIGQTAATSYEYGIGLSALAFLYLGGITSINGAILGGVIAGGGIVAYFGTWHSPGLFSYTSIMGGLGMVLTAIIHPAGQASIFQPLMQHLGGWLVKARGAEWLNSLKRYGPFIVLGAVWGVIGINPWRTDDYSRFWMALTGVFLVFFVRSIAVQVRAARAAKAAQEAELKKFLAEMEAAK
ncbi:MAG: ABC transporter permease subunit [Actinomycetota bacterium]